MTPTWFSRALASMCLCVSACLPVPPYTTADLARDGRRTPTRALLRYLAEPHADPAACTLPFVQHIELTGIEQLVDAASDLEVQPAVFRVCMHSALERWDRARQRRAVRHLGEAYLKVLRERDTVPQLRAAFRELLLRAPAARTERVALSERVAELRAGLVHGDFDHRATRPLAVEWLIALELGRDRFQGRPLTAENIRTLPDPVLRLASERLGKDALRDDARREWVRRRAARSPFALVRNDVEATVQHVMTHGHYVVDLTQHPVTELALDARKMPSHLIVNQNTEQGTALLMAARGKLQTPILSLREPLAVRAKGLEQPVKLCGPASELEPTPCIPTQALEIRAHESRIDQAGVLHLPDALPLERVLDLAALPSYELRIRSGEVVASAALPLALAPPPIIQVGGGLMGGAGPSLEVQVRERGGFALFDVQAPRQWGVHRRALLNLSAPGDFMILSVGGKGSTGSQGSRGFDGTDGMSGGSASCFASAGNGSSGSRGSNGGHGGTGGHGGSGGAISVTVSCTSTNCDALIALLHKIVRSVGGPGGNGGPGGPGGRGGRGGRGGASASCNVTDSDGRSHWESKSGGMDGMDGSDGSTGMSGSSGMHGLAGPVSIRRID